MKSKNFIPIAQPLIDENEAKAVYETIKSGWISMGKKVEEFRNRRVVKCLVHSSTRSVCSCFSTIEIRSLLMMKEPIESSKMNKEWIE